MFEPMLNRSEHLQNLKFYLQKNDNLMTRVVL